MTDNMGEQLTYHCTNCHQEVVGMSHALFVTGMLDGVFCTVQCLITWGKKYLNGVEQAMIGLFRKYEKGGSG
jgi:hypothetical protein